MRNCTRREPVRTRTLKARGRDLGIERPLVALADAVELAALIGDDPGEHVEPADRAFRVGHRRDALAQREMLEQRHDIDAVLFEDRALGQVDAVHRQAIELVAHARPRARQKARPHPVGDLAEPQIDARRLDLVVADRLGAMISRPSTTALAQQLRRQQPGRLVALALGFREKPARSRQAHRIAIRRGATMIHSQQCIHSI